MTPSVTAPSIRPFPRFTFAGRGCRDPRRELRRRPADLVARPTAASAPSAGTIAVLTEPSAGSAAEADAGAKSTTERVSATDRPPSPGRRA